MKRAHRIALKPTPEQEVLFGQHAGLPTVGELVGNGGCWAVLVMAECH